MVTRDIDNVQDSWRSFLMDAEMAKNYKRANMITGLGLPAPNPILEALLPSLLYIRLGAFLDDTLKEYITANGLMMGKPYHNDFNGRITFLNDQGLLDNASRLHALRRKRNPLAHKASHSCTWDLLEDAIVIASAELKHLGLVGSRPKYEFYAERNPGKQSEPEDILTLDYCYGLKVDGKKAMEVSWTEHHPKNGK